MGVSSSCSTIKILRKTLLTFEKPVPHDPLDHVFLILLLTSFQEISSKATETTKLNKYPPRIGPRGYRGMKPQWEKEMESGESTKFHNIRSERARNFILARLKRDPTGIYSLPTDLYSLASELIEKDTQLSHGDWFPGPGADVLTEVLGPEHPGRTRAVGHNVGLRQSMPRVDKKKRKSHDKYNLEDIK
ncbi:unnamed protein product [Lactuca virosa]|uniref:Uncharacterized protein n=1 Tax=Lactuca virosa TaxID=75947 RepID=A0AAU9MCC4_9ASTR|nr:unnamed protein product [Lactuca virosa]